MTAGGSDRGQETTPSGPSGLSRSPANKAATGNRAAQDLTKPCHAVIVLLREYSRHMRKIPHGYGHFAFSVIQSALTCAIAAAIASLPAGSAQVFFRHWLMSWGLSWMVMLPVVVVAAPFIRRLVARVTEGP